MISDKEEGELFPIMNAMRRLTVQVKEENLWWPKEVYEETEVTVQHSYRPEHKDHLYTLNQTEDRLIWVCKCGRSLARKKKDV